MGFTILWSEKAQSQLEKLPFTIKKAIFIKISGLASDPYSNSVKKLRGTDLFRLRVGDYRVIFEIEGKELRILILFLGHRKNVYKRFGV